MNSGPDHKSNWGHIWMLGIKGLLSWEYQMKFTEIEKDKMSRMWVRTWYCQVSQVTQEWLLFSKQHFGNLEITKAGHMIAQHVCPPPLYAYASSGSRVHCDCSLAPAWRRSATTSQQGPACHTMGPQVFSEIFPLNIAQACHFSSADCSAEPWHPLCLGQQ